MGYGIITLLPALLVIVVAIKSKRTTEALLIGCVSSYLIVAALWMRQASADINLPDYVISVVEPFVNANIYPLVAFIVVAVLGFITGSNWGIPAVCAPIIIPLGAACGANLLIVIAAIVCGGTFCSHACFYSDATVITSSSCGIENMEHVYSQLPYTMIAAGIASILFLIAGFIF